MTSLYLAAGDATLPDVVLSALVFVKWGVALASLIFLLKYGFAKGGPKWAPIGMTILVAGIAWWFLTDPIVAVSMFGDIVGSWMGGIKDALMRPGA